MEDGFPKEISLKTANGVMEMRSNLALEVFDIVSDSGSGHMT